MLKVTQKICEGYDICEAISSEGNERIVVVSGEEKPANFNGVWIQVKDSDRKSVASYIKAGLRMAPDEIRITSDLFGRFTLH